VQTFISYKREDQQFAERLRDSLRAWGYRTWIDIENIEKGAYWPDEIDEGLATADVVVGVISPDALQSRNVKNEWDWALTNGKRLLLVLFRTATLPHRYVSLNYIDFTHSEQRGLDQLRKVLQDPTYPEYRDEVSHVATPPLVVSPLMTRIASNRAEMLRKVREFWITGVLKNAVSDTAFELDMALKADVVLKHTDYGDYTLPPAANIIKVFDDFSRELLILGAPGAGKTILMLQLARDLLGHADVDESSGIPVVLNLSSWAAKRGTVADWLVERLYLEYQVPRKQGQRWVEDEKLLPLLDGLDEVTVDYRDDCVKAINDFRSQYATLDMVVCSRILDYEMLTSRLNLQGAIVLQPLTRDQISAYLDRPEFAQFRESMKAESYLWEMAKTPFLLHTMTFTYQNASAGVIERFADETDRRAHLFDHYVKRRFDQQSNNDYSLLQTRLWLSWLAGRMAEYKHSIFYIEELGWDWLGNHWERLLYRPGAILIGIAIGVFSGILIGGIAGVMSNVLDQETGLGIGVLIGAILGSVAGFFLTRSETIRSVEALTISWKIRSLLQGIIFGVLFGALVGLILSVAINVVIGIITGIVMGIAGVTVIAFSLNFRVSQRVESRSYPNQGIRLSLYNAVTVGVIVGILAALSAIISILLIGFLGLMPSGTLAVDLVRGLAKMVETGIWNLILAGIAMGVGAGLAMAMIFGGGDVIIKHLILRLFLYFRGETPLNYAHFLDFAASRVFLRKVGGGYIFIHRMLLEYFAEREATNLNKKTDLSQ
jgi:hypothetical protein